MFQVSSVQAAWGNTAVKGTNGTILISPVFIPATITVNEMHLIVSTALGAAGDVGVYDSNGDLVLNGGSGSLTTGTGLKVISPIQGGSSRILKPGQYYVAVTWNSTNGIIRGANLNTAGSIVRSGTLTGGGSVLPASITLASIVDGQYLYGVSLNN
jgi:hypothetical protein